jgi:hypothetical protein
MTRILSIVILLLCSVVRAQQSGVETGVNLSAYSQHATGHHQPTVGVFVQAIERRNNWAFIERVEYTNARKLYAVRDHSIKLEGAVRYYIKLVLRRRSDHPQLFDD